MEEETFGIIPVFIDKNIPYFLIVKLIAGHWAFSKGHIEEGETEIQAGKRELFEEVGIKKCKVLNKIFFKESFSYKKQGSFITKNVKYFLGFVKNKNVKIDGREVVDFEWLTFRDALKRITFSQAKNVLKEVNKFLKLNKTEIFKNEK